MWRDPGATRYDPQSTEVQPLTETFINRVAHTCWRKTLLSVCPQLSRQLPVEDKTK